VDAGSIPAASTNIVRWRLPTFSPQLVLIPRLNAESTAAMLGTTVNLRAQPPFCGAIRCFLSASQAENLRPKVLVASQPAAWVVIKPMLEKVADLVPVHTRAKALEVLKKDAAGFNLILCTVAFDDSRMIGFLQAVKRKAAMSRIPFLCSRVLASALSDKLMRGLRDPCLACGAIDMVDIGPLSRAAARDALQASVMKHASPSAA
jgi:hypothetical protein